MLKSVKSLDNVSTTPYLRTINQPPPMDTYTLPQVAVASVDVNTESLNLFEMVRYMLLHKGWDVDDSVYRTLKVSRKDVEVHNGCTYACHPQHPHARIPERRRVHVGARPGELTHTQDRPHMIRLTEKQLLWT